jgi:type II secretory pathway pseudopilin PulG
MGIIASIAIPKLLNITSKTTILKAKNDLNIILSGLRKYKNNLILQNNTNTLNSLDDDIYLFNKIIQQPFVASKNKATFWSKKSNTTYYYWIDNNTSIKFTYNKSKLTFKCNKTEPLCQEIIE